MVEQAQKEGKVLLKDIFNYMKGRIAKMVSWIISTGKGRVISFDSLQYETKNQIPLDLI